MRIQPAAVIVFGLFSYCCFFFVQLFRFAAAVFFTCYWQLFIAVFFLQVFIYIAAAHAFCPFPLLEREDVLLFQSFLLQKRASPGYITEGSQSVYSVKLNGPPPTNVAIELNASDQLTRYGLNSNVDDVIICY